MRNALALTLPSLLLVRTMLALTTGRSGTTGLGLRESPSGFTNGPGSPLPAAFRRAITLTPVATRADHRRGVAPPAVDRTSIRNRGLRSATSGRAPRLRAESSTQIPPRVGGGLLESSGTLAINLLP